MSRQCCSKSKESGATLLITMIFLVLLTYLGVSSIQDTALEEKMAANARHSDLVFQAAEDALRRGEQLLDGTAVLPNFDNTGGYYEEDYNVESFIETADLSSCTGLVAGAGGCADYADNTIKAGFVLQKMSAVGTGDSLETGTVQDKQDFYRITAKAESDSTSAITILQIIFRR